MNKKTLTIGNKYDIPYILSGSIGFFILTYFIFSREIRGDEEVYFEAFTHATKSWPMLDTSPLWSISSVYLWVISSFTVILNHSFNEITIGRLLSLICWVFLLFVSNKNYQSARWGLFFLFFNPYVLIYSTRAHPLLPSLVLVWFFWKFINERKPVWGLFLLFAVNFQVFMGGVTAMLLPESFKNLNWEKIKLSFWAGVVSVFGVLVTWATWGGIYPQAFVNHEFFKIHHANGTASLGYIPLMFLLTGGMMWLLGKKSFNEKIVWNLNSWLITGFLVLSLFVLITGREITGLLYYGLNSVLPPLFSKIILILTLLFLGLGWFKIHRDFNFLLWGIIGSGILLTVLPYLYERIATFGILAPIMLWLLKVKFEEEKYNQNLFLVISAFSLVFAIFYEKFGAL